MGMGGEDRPIERTWAARCSPMVAAPYNAVGALPLAEGYTTTFRNFDLQKAKTH